MGIIISKNGNKAKVVKKSEINKEDYLQDYIHRNPETIPVYEISKDKKLLVLKREFITSSGSIDALAIDKDGDIYVIETKRYVNSTRREVVAQALDYGAALWKHFNDFDEFVGVLDTEVKKRFGMSFKEKIRAFFKLEDEGLEYLMQNLKNNLDDGNLKFVILMDSMDERLKDLILYVNQNSQFDIYAVRLECYRYDDYEIMIPKIFGVEVKKKIKSTNENRRKIWDEDSFINQTRELLKDQSNFVIKVFEYFKDKGEKINWGSGKITASFSPIINKFDKTISPFTFCSNGDIFIKFNWIYGKAVNKELVKKIAEKFFREMEKIGLEFTSDSLLLKSEFTIKSNDFLNNFDDIFKSIKIIVEDNVEFK